MLIDVDALRSYLADYYGTAMMAGFSTALLDMSEIEGATEKELCRIAERLGVNLGRFAITDR